MIAAHLTNGMLPTDDEPTTKRKAHDKAKVYRSRGVFACVFQDNETKKHLIFVPIGVTLSLF